LWTPPTLLERPGMGARNLFRLNVSEPGPLRLLPRLIKGRRGVLSSPQVAAGPRWPDLPPLKRNKFRARALESKRALEGESPSLAELPASN
jgi:hypothetical protein